MGVYETECLQVAMKSLLFIQSIPNDECRYPWCGVFQVHTYQEFLVVEYDVSSMSVHQDWSKGKLSAFVQFWHPDSNW